VQILPVIIIDDPTPALSLSDIWFYDCWNFFTCVTWWLCQMFVFIFLSICVCVCVCVYVCEPFMFINHLCLQTIYVCEPFMFVNHYVCVYLSEPLMLPTQQPFPVFVCHLCRQKPLQHHQPSSFIASVETTTHVTLLHHFYQPSTG